MSCTLSSNMEVILNDGDGILLVLPDLSAVLDILDYTTLLNCLIRDIANVVGNQNFLLVALKV